MKIFFSPYTLHPLQKANRLSSMDPLPGIILKGEEEGIITYADYLPHQPLGDQSCDEFLQNFVLQNHEHSRKAFYFLKMDRKFQKQKAIKFYNHQLWKSSDPLESPLVKYKLEDAQDTHFLGALFKGIRVRLDANALFDKQGFFEFIKLIPPHLHNLIDYVEDPLYSLDWEGLNFPCAQDILKGTPAQFIVYKPNRGFLPAPTLPIIYSSYMGHELGKWHAYCDLVNFGDLTQYHGIITNGYYEEEKNLFVGEYLDSFSPDLEVVNSIYQEMKQKTWTYLCTI